MSQSQFHFKQFSISQQHSAMKLSTDALLLGGWCEISSATHILDIGAGTGVLSLMAAQRNSSAKISAIEPDMGSYSDALENIRASVWADRIWLHNVKLQEFKGGSFDHIICNPPYFSRSLHSPDMARTAARHNDSLPFDELISSASKMLTESGQLSVILPYDQMEEFLYAAQGRLHLVRRRGVATKPNGAIKRVLMALSKRELPPIEEPTLIIGGGTTSTYSNEYRELTSEFYLKL